MSSYKAPEAFLDVSVCLEGGIESVFWAPEFPMGPNIGVALTSNLKM
jgi:hypothetical protein